MDASSTEWAQLTPDRLLIADERGAWLEGVNPGSARGAMQGAGRVATTRKLLDGAVGAGFSTARPAQAPAMTRARWVFRLAGLYHLTHSTPSLLVTAARTFEAAGRAALKQWAHQKAREERGHDTLALRDLTALGYPASTLVEALRPPIAARLLGYFEETARAGDPVGCVGYSYALERLAMTVGAAELAAVDALMPDGVRATRCLRVHSGLGSDADHVADTLAVVASLSGPERAAVAVACYRASRLCFEPPPGGHPTDDDIERTLRALPGAPIA